MVITFLPRSKCLLISWLQSPSAVILEPQNIKSLTVSTVSPSICQLVCSKGDQPRDFFGRNDAKAEAPVLWPPHVKSWLIGKDSDAGRDWGQEEKGTTEDEMAGWHHWLDGCDSEWTPGDGDEQGGLACCDSWGLKESDTTERLNWTTGKEPTCQCRRYKRHQFGPSVWKVSWRRAWQPTLVFLPRKSTGQRSLAGYSSWGCKELDTTEWLNWTELN